MPVVWYMGKPPELSAEEEYCLTNCSTYEQYHHMRTGFENNTCPFCVPDHVRNVKLEGTNAHWYVCDNAFPRDTLETQLLMWPHRHVRNPWDLSQEEWLALFDVLRWVESEYHLPGGMLFARFGDNRWSEGTVPHLHFHIWVPNNTDEVRIPILKNATVRAENANRAAAFAARYEAGEKP